MSCCSSSRQNGAAKKKKKKVHNAAPVEVPPAARAVEGVKAPPPALPAEEATPEAKTTEVGTVWGLRCHSALLPRHAVTLLVTPLVGNLK